MIPYRLTQKESRRASPAAGTGNVVLRLGWPQFWLLISTLGGLLALVALGFLAATR